MNHGLITIGRYNDEDDYLSSVEILNDQNEKKEWKYLSSMNNKRDNCSLTSIANKLFAVGGREDDYQYLNSSEMCDLNDDKNKNQNEVNQFISSSSKWINLTNINHKKQSIGIKYFQNKNEIILIGGFNHHNLEESARSFSMFEMMKNKFIEYSKTSQKHSWRPGIVIENNNLIYIIGNNGYNNNSEDYPFGVIECFDIRDKKWFEIDELSKIFHNIDNKKRYFQCVLNCI